MSEATFHDVRVSGENSSMLIALDNMWFENCSFEDCDVFYSGGPTLLSVRKRALCISLACPLKEFQPCSAIRVCESQRSITRRGYRSRREQLEADLALGWNWDLLVLPARIR